MTPQGKDISEESMTNDKKAVLGFLSVFLISLMGAHSARAQVVGPEWCQISEKFCLKAPQAQTLVRKIQKEMDRFHYDPKTGKCLNKEGVQGYNKTDDLMNGECGDFHGLDLHGADLLEADLRGANLKDASFEYADLSGAALMGADLRGANLKNADLSRAEIDAHSRFKNAGYNEHTQLPFSFDEASKRGMFGIMDD